MVPLCEFRIVSYYGPRKEDADDSPARYIMRCKAMEMHYHRCLHRTNHLMWTFFCFCSTELGISTGSRRHCLRCLSEFNNGRGFELIICSSIWNFGREHPWGQTYLLVLVVQTSEVFVVFWHLVLTQPPISRS